MNASSINDLLRVGPGTPMGNFMRRYWLPAALSSEVQADGAPVRIMILGEKLIAFRDSAGRVGILDHRCPHRCASLFMGRNEENGIRCVYHGWKFDVDGNCLDMPNVPERQDFRAKVHAKAYKAAERNGLIWVYMGEDQDSPPELPHIEANLIANSKIWCLQRQCNWLQALEGDIDTSHVGFLHVGALTPEDLPEDSPLRPTVHNRSPEYKVRTTDWGAMYGAYRESEDGRMSWRVAHFLFPFWTMTPNILFATRAIARAWVPMDDTHVMLFDITGGVDEGNPFFTTKLKNGEPMYQKIRRKPNGTGWFDRWLPIDGEHNDWGMDRQAQRDMIHYTGIDNPSMQDQSITESMGPITDHSFEHLAPTDQMIAIVRRQLAQALDKFRGSQAAAPCAPDTYFGARSGSFWVDDPQTPLADAYQAELQRATRWQPDSQPRV
ncbi:Rieske 2Fe-2S domain-containing protein [Candidimonas humi]|uniref:Rieske 2Fe-2S domain-containing protein n=1 Tax=Candidimonas humi TaxID=683355 RepID=A0ABV8NZQ0_9BURK|nr:Rieske 2Fe-2S domain-containing protein [Candidimonas humi]MBV6304135.1 Rieske 2Fe-2S domain-containing protein [Candidimonas humi]